MPNSSLPTPAPTLTLSTSPLANSAAFVDVTVSVCTGSANCASLVKAIAASLIDAVMREKKSPTGTMGFENATVRVTGKAEKKRSPFTVTAVTVAGWLSRTTTKVVGATVLPARSTKAVDSSASVYSTKAAVEGRGVKVTSITLFATATSFSSSTSSTLAPAGVTTANSSSMVAGGIAILWSNTNDTVLVVRLTSVDTVTGATGSATGCSL